MTKHQIRQIEIINQIEHQIKTNSLTATTVIPVQNFEKDKRLCLTSVHFPSKTYVDQVYKSITKPLKMLFSKAYYYPPSSLHLTIKNVCIISDPPSFNEQEIITVQKVFNQIIPTHKQFKIYPYKLLLFKNNLALMGTTDKELDSILLHLASELKKVGIIDNKQYVNSRYFFSNMTLARFGTKPPQDFVNMVTHISSNLDLKPYIVDSVSLITSNAVMKKLKIHGKWPLLA